jgi:hypothetical protein
MSKTRITVATVGHMPADFDRKKIENWKSSVFDITGPIESYSLTCDSDGEDWEFTDKSLETVLPNNFDGEFLVAVVNVPIELNWYSRRLSANRVTFSYHEIKEILRASNIPLENAVFRLLYAYTLLYKRSGNRIPDNAEPTNFTHDETRGCLYDMNGIKTDIIYSCHKPIICPDCVERLKREKVSMEVISKCQADIRRIQKAMFYRMSDFIKKHPLWSIGISAVAAVVLGSIGSVLGSYVYEAIKSQA